MITTDNILIYSMKMDLERLFFKNKHLRKDFLKELKFSVENYEPTEDNFKSFGIGVHMSDDETLLRFYNRHKNYFKYSKEEAESILQVEDYKSDNLYRRYILSIAKKEGKYKGRKAKEVDKNFEEQYNRYLNRELNKTELAKVLEVSRPTLDKLIKEYEQQSSEAKVKKNNCLK